MPLVASGQFTITDSADNISMVLSSDSFIVATNSDGSNGNYSNCVCTVKVLHGFLDETSKWTITAGTPTGLTGVLSSTTYTVSNATLDTSSVDITATRSGYSSITKRLTVSKAKAGATGAKGDQGPSVTVTANRAMSFTSTDGALDVGQADIVFTTATSGITSPTYVWTFAGLQTNPTASTTATQTVTAAQFGTSRSATVTCTVGTYKQTLTIVRLEKSTAAAGATVGADATNFTGTLGGDNLALNSEFERRSSTHTPTGYAVYNNSGSGTATFVASTGITGSGAGVKAGTTPGSTLGIFANTAMGGGAEGGWVANETYVVSFYAKKVAGAGFSGTGLRWNVQPATSVALLNPVLTASYQRYAFRITWGATVESNGGFFLTREGSTVAGDEIHFDRLMIQRGDVLMDWAPSRRDGIRATTGATAPADPIDGDTWVDTSTIPNVTKIRVSGSWQIGGNYTTNTNQLTDGAGLGTTATWSGVGSMPANISTAGSTPTVDLRNNQIGLNASGQLYGAGAGNGTTVSNAQISVDTATGVIGGIGTGAGTAVANSQVAFSARQTWEFRGSAEGWATTQANITSNADSITLTSTGGDPMLHLSGLSIKGAVFDKLRMRVRRIAGTGWDGTVYYATSATSPNTHGFDGGYKKELNNSLLSTSFVMLEWDMANLTVGGNNWTASTITAIRFDLGSTASDVFEIDWISVGKYGHDVDLVLSAASQIIAGTETTGVILDAASKSLQVMTGGSERVRLGNQPTAVNGSAYGMVVKDTSGNVVFDSRNNVGIVGNQTYDNFNLGDSTTNPLWDGNTGGTGNVALGANALRADGLTGLTTRSNNVALGSGALRYTTTGGNIAVGAGALRGVSSGNTGTDNIAIGFNAMINAVVPTYNVAIGRATLGALSSGTENVAIGYNAMQAGTNSSYSVAVGHQTLKAAQGYNNTALGYKAGIAQTSPDNNTLVGYKAGTYITTGGGNTYIGSEAGNTLDPTTENMVVITSGFGDALVIEPNALAKIYGNKIWHEGSDGAESGLDADLLDGYQAAITATVSTVAVRDGSGDIHTRLIRSEYSNETTISGAMAYRVESTSGGNNYVRFCSDKAAIKAYLGVVERDAFGGYYPSASGRNIDDASAGDVGLYSKNGGGTWPSNLVSEFAWVETQKMYIGNASVQHAVEYTGTGTPTGEQWFRTRSNAAAPYVWSAWRRVVTDGNYKSVLSVPAPGNWFNGGYVNISAGGAVEMGRFIDWHYASTDTTDYTARTEVDSGGNLTHGQGLKVKGTGGLGYAFGGAVTQLTSRDTGVTLNTPSGTITLATVATTSETLNKFTLTNSCIQATDVVTVCMRNSGTGRYNVFVDRVVAGACDIRLQNQATTISEACSLNFAIIKGANA